MLAGLGSFLKTLSPVPQLLATFGWLLPKRVASVDVVSRVMLSSSCEE
jgi:hypothetical protein